jgi:decaprenylphospho-beta-D-erythro-pentofuranosid-2-ulose 2-reductase
MTTADNWVLLGASSPIARAFARNLARPGCHIILAGRDREDMEATAADLRLSSGASAEVFPFDAADFSSHQAAARQWAEREGRLNAVLLFSAMPEQNAIDSDPALLRDCITVTYTGAVSVLHNLAPHLEARKAGTIIAIGSVAGDRGRLKNYVYGSAKAGLHTYLQGLRNRLARSGVHVLTAKPGFVDTSLTWGAPGIFLVASPDAVARKCLAAAAKRRNTCYVPLFWLPIMTVIRLIPEAIFKRLRI